MGMIGELSPEQLHHWPGEALQLVDVRTDEEVRQGVIEGMIHIPMHQIPKQMDTLQKERPVVLYCAMGSRSAQVAEYLADNGFEEVYNLVGGIEAWVQQYPVTLPE